MAGGTKQLGTDTVITELASADKVTVYQASTSKNKSITKDNLGIQLKGYKEYTFAIRQSSTDAPTIYVIKDDFGLASPLTFSYLSAGSYLCDIVSLGLTIDETFNLSISNNIAFNTGGNEIGVVKPYIYTSSSQYLRIYTFTLNADGTQTAANSILQSSGSGGCIISIRETIEDT